MINNMKKSTYFKTKLLAVMLLAGSGSAWGQVSITTGGTAYTQNFDDLQSTTGTGITWTDNTTIAGWYAYNIYSSGSAISTYISDIGTSITGGIHDYGIAGTNAVTDRALGALSTGSATPVFGENLINNTGLLITSERNYSPYSD